MRLWIERQDYENDETTTAAPEGTKQLHLNPSKIDRLKSDLIARS